MFTDLRDKKDLIDRTPFIDYISFFVSDLPLGWFVAVENGAFRCEGGDDYFRLYINGKFLRGKFTSTPKTFTYVFSNEARFHFESWEPHEETYGNNMTCKIDFPSTAIPYGTLTYQIAYIKRLIKGFHPKGDYSLIKGHNLPRYLNLNTVKISRLDLSLNILERGKYENNKYISFLDYENIEFWVKGRVSQTLHYDAVKNGKPLATGITRGKGNSGSIQLKIYNKRHDPKRQHDIIKYGTDRFHRLEYKIQRKAMKPIEFRGDRVDCLGGLEVYHIFTIWRYMVRNKAPRLGISEDCWKPYPKNQIEKIKPAKMNDEQRYKTIKGYLAKYEKDEFYPELIESLNYFFVRKRSNDNQGFISKAITNMREIKKGIKYLKQ